ncbi:DUF4278 domain-containing protein [Leptolyngbya sp. AN02str]|uniref:DUF4278 domain-containing protein n=1 Tax=Leptolyngbya sp. AN02str TaxID=3423363 RepID=UPI003D30FCBA
MKALYRGIPYETSTSSINSTETHQVGIFLGNRFTIQQHNTSQRHIAAQLKYRGVDYSV